MSGTKYVFTSAMSQLSGFGGGYEDACRKMVVTGLEWLDAHPEADPKFRGFKEVFGILTDDNDDAKALSEAVVGAVDDCTGAMHHQAINHILWIRKNGWKKYVEEMEKPDAS